LRFQKIPFAPGIIFKKGFERKKGGVRIKKISNPLQERDSDDILSASICLMASSSSGPEPDAAQGMMQSCRLISQGNLFFMG
jgi:hypothetical protein